MNEVSPYATFLRDLKPLPGQLLMAYIAGPLEPVEVVAKGSGNSEHRALEFSCGDDGSEAQAVPPVRLDAFFDLVPSESTRTSICNEDLSGAVQRIADSFGDLTRGCLGDLTDTDPDAPGVQPVCTVSEARATVDGTVESTLPRCDNDDPQMASVLPCHTIKVDSGCVGGSGLAVAAHYENGEVPAVTRTIARCRVN
jgi:hypothetical protein